MYSGELRRATFEFNGPSIEAVLDRLPAAEIVDKKNSVYTINAEVYGNGIDMWLRSQGNNVIIFCRNDVQQLTLTDPLIKFIK